jgi:GNAT superfamily N-acetyltransferase
MIKKATAKDIDALIAIQSALEAESAIWGYCADTVEAWMQRDLSWTLLASTESQLVGFVCCAPRACDGECVFPDSSKVLEVLDLAVIPSCRGNGLGRHLLAAIEQQAREEGYTHLRLYSAARRFDDMLRFYRRCGFTPWYLEMTKDIGAKSSSAREAIDHSDNDAEQPHAADAAEPRR